MERYLNLSGDSGVTDYEVGSDFIEIRFQTGWAYRYGSVKPGKPHVMELKGRAIAGPGLATYLSQHRGLEYESKRFDA